MNNPQESRDKSNLVRKDPETNGDFLREQQAHASELLEAYERLAQEQRGKKSIPQPPSAEGGIGSEEEAAKILEDSRMDVRLTSPQQADLPPAVKRALTRPNPLDALNDLMSSGVEVAPGKLNQDMKGNKITPHDLIEGIIEARNQQNDPES